MRKGQEEITGFVVIVVLVAVVLVIILGIMLRGGSSASRESIEAGQFLESVLSYTTDCAKVSPAYISIGRAIKECRAGTVCASGKKSCDALEENAAEIMEKSWNMGEGSYYSGYVLNVTEKTNQSVWSMSGGNCSGSYMGSREIIFDRGAPLEVEFRICTRA